MSADAAAALRVLADLAPSGDSGSRPGQAVTDRVLIPLDAVRFLRMPLRTSPEAPLDTGDHRGAVIDLVKRARLHGEEGDLRIGWLWLVTPGSPAPTRTPLVSARIEASVSGGELFGSTMFSTISIARVGDLELSDLITDEAVGERLEADVAFGGGALAGHADIDMPPALLARLTDLVGWGSAAAEAAGAPRAHVVTVEPEPIDRPVVVAQVGLYLRERPQASAGSIAQSLYAWSRDDVGATAFAALYELPDRSGLDDDPADTAPAGEDEFDDDVVSSVVLSPSQQSAVRCARAARTTVVSGPPGSGKTQTVAAAALDVVEHGGSVLVAAPSHAAVEALTTLLTDAPGPDPVVFGDTALRLDVADRLGQGGGELVDRRAVAQARERYGRADAEYRAQLTGVIDVLDAERAAGRTDPVRTFRARQVAPRWFEPAADLVEADQLLQRVATVAGWFADFRRRRALDRLRSHAAATTADVEQLADALATARAERAAVQLVATGGLDVDASLQQLARLEAERREWLGRLRHAEAHDASRVDRRARSTMGAVAAALRSGRARRRRRLGTIDGADMVTALPLWVGTLRDVDDLLPRTPAMFDLVIIDEASQVDQIQAAPALLRARRSMIVGDPKQLRHVSFLADDDIARAIERKGAGGGPLAHLLDVRRMSLFDLGAATARTRMLDEHFRSTPHLIEFSARRFYDGRLQVATRHPSNHSHDHIRVRQLAGARSEDGVNEAEVDAALDIVAELAAQRRAGDGVGSVGVVTPTRAQADRIENAALERFDLATIDELRLRVGTVHGFQGCERDTTVISLGLDDASAAGSRSFVANPNLFNVMITRAKQRIELLTSLAEPDGLIGDYVWYAAEPPNGPLGTTHRDPEIAGLAADLHRAGVPVITNYPAGRHMVDLVVGDGQAAVAVTFGVHPDGPLAHVERELTLRRFGWTTMGVFASRWEDRWAELALELARIARATSSPQRPDQA